MGNRYNSNNQNARQQELVRRILTIAIFTLAVIVLVLLAIVIRKNASCSSPAANNVLPSNSAGPITAKPNETPFVQPTDAIITSVPTETPTVVPETTAPVGVQRSVTIGSMNDVLNRIEELKTLPSGEKIILIDVGHGGFDGGAVGRDTGVTEAKLNLDIARLVSDKLAEKGYYVLLTRMGEYACADTKNADMAERKRIMKLDMFACSVSIHMNALETDRSVHGVRLYHYENGTEGEKLAATILKAVRDLTDETRTNTYTGNIMVVREPVAPSALVECGFITNAAEEKRLQDPAYQAILSQAIANGIENYLNGNVG